MSERLTEALDRMKTKEMRTFRELFELNEDYVKQLTGDQGEPGEDGRDGVDGKNGKDGIDGKDGVDGKDGRNGHDGKNGINGTDGQDGIDGKDGQNGKDGENGSPDTSEEIRNKLESLEGDDRLDKDAIKGLDEIEKNLEKKFSSSVKSGGARGVNLYVDGVKKGLVQYVDIKAGTNVTLGYSNVDGKANITVNSTGGGFNVETPVGSINGSNLTFTVSNTPKAIVLRNMTYFQNEGYTLSSLTITMNAALTPQTGDSFRSLY